MEEIKKEELKYNYFIPEERIKSTAVTQCRVHQWQPKGDNQLYCPVCESGANIKDGGNI